MEINKQLFEDVLFSKLKGTFVLKNGITVNSNKLIRIGFRQAYGFKGRSYIFDCNGETSVLGFSIIDFILDTNMKENELTIEIPDNKVVDWEESKKQNKIILKDKQLTYEDICKKLFENKEFFFINNTGAIQSSSPTHNEYLVYAINNSTSYHQLECILAKNQLANVALYLNDGWTPTYKVQSLLENKCVWIISNFLGIHPEKVLQNSIAFSSGTILFKTKELAQQAVEILGEETVKLALEPLGIG